MIDNDININERGQPVVEKAKRRQTERKQKKRKTLQLNVNHLVLGGSNKIKNRKIHCLIASTYFRLFLGHQRTATQKRKKEAFIKW